MNDMIPELQKYYIPCKSKKYLNQLNEKKCITILRQFLKIHNHTLNSKERYIKGKKQLFPFNIILADPFAIKFINPPPI